MSDHAGTKAELDKAGILFEQDKADLDKEGISLRDGENAGSTLQEDAHQGDTTRKKAAGPQQYKVLIIAATIGIILMTSGALLWNTQRNTSAAPVPATYMNEAQPVPAYSPEGDIVLDPFMILLDSHSPSESGLLIAQISLQVSPETSADIERSLYAIRSLILERISANALIYSKNELADMLRHDLQDYKIKDVAFIQYELR